MLNTNNQKLIYDNNSKFNISFDIILNLNNFINHNLNQNILPIYYELERIN